MTALGTALRFFLVWIALVAAQICVGMFIHIDAPQVPHAMLWLAISDAIQALAIATIALRSDWRDWKLGIALYLVPAAIITVNTIEGIVFLTNVPLNWGQLLVFNLVSLAAAAVLWMLIYRSAPIVESTNDSPLPHRTFGQMAWRFVLCAICYFVLYFTAGTIIFPFVREYYAHQHLPSFGQLVSLQVFLRGPIFVLVCLMLLRMLRLPRFSGAIGVGLTFTLLSGVATLIVPNGIFPDSVRWVHFWEVTCSNFVFGFVVGWVWGHAEHVKHLAPVHA